MEIKKNELILSRIRSMNVRIYTHTQSKIGNCYFDSSNIQHVTCYYETDLQF